MSVLKIKSNNVNLELQLDGNACVSANGCQLTVGTRQTGVIPALIALALSSEFAASSEHDGETGIITIQSHPTEWNSKSFGFTNTTINRSK